MKYLLAIALFLTSDAWSAAGSIGEHPQLQREQSLSNTFYTSITTVTFSGTAENPFLLFVNPSANTINAFLDLVHFGNTFGDSGTTFRVYRTPIISSSGTLQGIGPAYSGNTTPSVMQVFRAPTVTDKGTLVYMSIVRGSSVDFELKQSRIFIPGTKFLITTANEVTNTPAFINLQWSEE